MKSEADRSPSRPAALDLDSRHLSELAPRMPFWKGMEIGVQGQPSDSLYIIAEGQVLLSRTGPGRAEHALYLLAPGDLFGEGSLRPERCWLVTARAATDGVVHVLPSGQLSRFAQYFPRLAAHLIILLSGRLERAHQRLDLIGIHSARERVLGLLRILSEVHGQDDAGRVWMPIRLSQSAFGEMIGLARETVARVFTELQDEGIIERPGREGFWLKLPRCLGFFTALLPALQLL